MVLYLQPETKNELKSMSRSTFKILFYVNKGKEKDGIVPVMGRITINGTQSQFSCKHSIPLDMWDVKGNCVKGRSKESLQINRDLDNIKAQIVKHYQHLSDREAFVTAEMVRNSYQGFGSEYETLLNAFDKDIANAMLCLHENWLCVPLMVILPMIGTIPSFSLPLFA